MPLITINRGLPSQIDFFVGYDEAISILEAQRDKFKQDTTNINYQGNLKQFDLLMDYLLKEKERDK